MLNRHLGERWLDEFGGHAELDAMVEDSLQPTNTGTATSSGSLEMLELFIGGCVCSLLEHALFHGVCAISEV